MKGKISNMKGKIQIRKGLLSLIYKNKKKQIYKKKYWSVIFSLPKSTK